MTTARYNVFIDGARQGRAGVPALARAIAARYGLPAADLEQRLAAGRFRVKGNVDRATADSYVADLSSLGAVCSIEPVAAAAPTAAAAVTLPGGARSQAPAPAAPAPVAPAPRVGDDFGALSGETPLTLSTLDGASEDEARASRKIPLSASFGPPAEDSGRGSSRKIPLPASFGPPAEDSGRGSSKKIPLPASFGPAADDALPASFGPPMDIEEDDAPVEVFDPFAPPEMQSDAPDLEIAVERKPRATKAAAPEPAPSPAIATPTPQPAPAKAAAASTGGRGNPLALLRDDGLRFIAGVVLAVLIAAIPALVIGTARQRSAFTRIDDELNKHQDAVKTREEWDGLDRKRAAALSTKGDERQSIVVTTWLLWAVLAGGLSWLWFRKIDWDRVLK